jgi:hypothetical protein
MKASRPVLFLLTFLCLVAMPVSGQQSTETSQPANPPSEPRLHARILYTGKLMGYMRIPDHQSALDQTCPDYSALLHPVDRSAATVPDFKAGSNDASYGVKEFIDQLRVQLAQDKDDPQPNPILVGMGDNFAPDYGARVFFNYESDDRISAPTSNLKDPTLDLDDNAPNGPEKYFYDWNWRFSGSPAWEKSTKIPPHSPLAVAEEGGLGRIPMDNVGCFLKNAGYAAVVPGKHDFYYGPERLRALARYLATPWGEKQSQVQMLAANLVVRTSYHEEKHTDLPDAYKKLNFQVKGGDFTPVTIHDKDQVLPWLRFARFQLKLNNPPDLEKLLNSVQSCVIQADIGNPNEFPDPNDVCLWQPATNWTTRKNLSPYHQFSATQEDHTKTPGLEAVTFDVDLTKIKFKKKDAYEAKNSAKDEGVELFGLARDRTNALCVKKDPSLDPKSSTGMPQDKGPFCVRFTVDTPFFQYPRPLPQDNVMNHAVNCGLEPVLKDHPDDYCEPEPFVMVEKGGQTPVAIFGVVDPNINGTIGELNLEWENDNSKYITQALSVDPKKALEAQLQFLDWKWKTDHHGSEFPGAKILLAQMSAPLAGGLKAHFPSEFNAILTEAEEELATPDETVRIEPSGRVLEDETPKTNTLRTDMKDAVEGTVVSPPTILVVPAPHYTALASQREIEIPLLDIQGDIGPQKPWTYKISRERIGLPRKSVKLSEVPAFVNQVQDAIRDIVGPGVWDQTPLKKGTDTEAAFQYLTLLQMARTMHTDVALIQKRDFFWPFVDPAKVDAKAIPELVEQVLWKGDLLIRMAVLGSALKSVLADSQKFANDEQNALSISDESGWDLVAYGLSNDASGQPQINGEPLDPNKLYSIAVTDYIGLGDTGYPELATSAVGEATHIQDLHDRMTLVSRDACKALQQVDAQTKCAWPVFQRGNFDQTADAPQDTTRGDTVLQQLGRWSFLIQKKSDPNPLSKKQTGTPWLDRYAQNRRYLFVSLQNASVSLSAIRNNINETDRSNSFNGVSFPSQVASVSAHDINIGLQWSGGEKTQRWDLVQSGLIAFEQTGKAQVNAGAQEQYATNQMTLDLSFFWHRNRVHRIGPIIGVHDERNFVKPLDTLSVSNSNLLPPNSLTAPCSATPLPSGLNCSSTLNVSLHEDRADSVMNRVGIRGENISASGSSNSFEAGFENGGQTRVIAYDFASPSGDSGPTLRCSVQAGVALSDCISKYNSATANAANPITEKFTDSILMSGHKYRIGAYANFELAPPLTKRLSLDWKETLEWFKPRANSISTDPHFYSWTTFALKYKLWNNLSIQPEYDLFFYLNQANPVFVANAPCPQAAMGGIEEISCFANKQTSPGNQALTQRQWNLSLTYQFDWRRGDRWRDALRYGEQSSGSGSSAGVGSPTASPSGSGSGKKKKS